MPGSHRVTPHQSRGSSGPGGVRLSQSKQKPRAVPKACGGRFHLECLLFAQHPGAPGGEGPEPRAGKSLVQSDARAEI